MPKKSHPENIKNAKTVHLKDLFCLLYQNPKYFIVSFWKLGIPFKLPESITNN